VAVDGDDEVGPRREVAVDRADPDARPRGDVAHRRVDPRGDEGRRRRVEEGLLVAAGVGAAPGRSRRRAGLRHR
jgi:hypothetical protein